MTIWLTKLKDFCTIGWGDGRVGTNGADMAMIDDDGLAGDGRPTSAVDSFDTL
jgi:hypothetical protein